MDSSEVPSNDPNMRDCLHRFVAWASELPDFKSKDIMVRYGLRPSFSIESLATTAFAPRPHTYLETNGVTERALLAIVKEGTCLKPSNHIADHTNRRPCTLETDGVSPVGTGLYWIFVQMQGVVFLARDSSDGS